MKNWLENIEVEHNIDILYACEAGSRAWGSGTDDSDYDIRFIYRFRDIRQYLSIDTKKEVIDYKSPYDVHGWDIFKAFQLLKKSNPSIYEWAYSPIVYKKNNDFLLKLRTFIHSGYSKYSLCMHYISILNRNIKEISGKPLNTKRQKQLIQAYRALLITRMLINNRDLAEISFINKIEIKPERDKIEDIYVELMKIKKQFMIISNSQFTEIIHLLSEEKNRLLKNLKKDNVIDNSPIINKWIWELLNV